MPPERAALALAGALLAGLALLVAARPEEPPSPAPAPAPARAEPPRIIAPLAAPEGRPSEGAERAARRFLAAYLAYGYGRPHPGFGRSAAPALAAELAAAPPRPPAEGRPRVARLLIERRGPGRALAVAEVEDGRRAYAVPLALERRGSWRVAGIGH